MTEQELIEKAGRLADNAFECSTKFTYKVANKFNNYFALIFSWLIVLTIIVVFKV